MGVSCVGLEVWDTGNDCKNCKRVELINPDPYSFTIYKKVQIGKHCVCGVTYHNCTNYEGKKILLYKDTDISQFKLVEKLDPHFSEDKNGLYPFARFEPTEEGIEKAILLATLMDKLERDSDE